MQAAPKMGLGLRLNSLKLDFRRTRKWELFRDNGRWVFLRSLDKTGMECRHLDRFSNVNRLEPHCHHRFQDQQAQIDWLTYGTGHLRGALCRRRHPGGILS